MNMIFKEERFSSILRMLYKSGHIPEFSKAVASISRSKLDSVTKHEYDADGKHWTVYDGPTFKMALDSGHTYHCFFDKLTGFNCRFGKTVDDNPEYCGLGPEIADIEIVTGSCPKVNSENCRWCYKNNTSAPGKVMTLEQFKTVVSKFPKNLTQVALGITGVKSNPQLEDILIWLKQQGVIGNLTLTGADIDDKMADVLCQYCGACAVSCYDKAKDLCYATIKKLHDTAKDKFKRSMSVNMHIVIADFSMAHVMDVLHDVRDGKVPGLKSVVMLHAKPVGRAKSLDCSLSEENLTEVIKFCLDNKISFGFDSCNGHNVQDILIKMGKQGLCGSIEPCESGRMSIYVNVEGKVTPCSFVEHVYEGSAIDLLDPAVKIEDVWMEDKMLNEFRHCTKCSKSCPIYALDCK